MATTTIGENEIKENSTKGKFCKGIFLIKNFLCFFSLLLSRDEKSAFITFIPPSSLFHEHQKLSFIYSVQAFLNGILRNIEC
jgi:hypothetical protein